MFVYLTMLNKFMKPLDSYDDFLFNDINKVKDYVKRFKSRYSKNKKKRGLLIVGPSGVGKTLAVKTVSNLEDYELKVVSSDEKRDKNKIKEIEKNSGQFSLFMKKRLVLIETIESFTRQDRGGLNEVGRFIKKSSDPIILTANNVDHYKYNKIKKKCKVIRFEPIPDSIIYKKLKEISKIENFNITDSKLKVISKKSEGDFRGALINLFVFGVSDTKDEDNIVLREKREHIRELVKLFFYANSEIIENKLIDVDAENLISWLDENLKETQENLDQSYYWLKKSSNMMKNIKVTQYWRLLYYVFKYITNVADYAKPNNKTKKGIKESKINLKKWFAKRKYKKMIDHSKKVAKELNISKKEVLDNYNLYKNIIIEGE